MYTQTVNSLTQLITCGFGVSRASHCATRNDPSLWVSRGGHDNLWPLLWSLSPNLGVYSCEQNSFVCVQQCARHVPCPILTQQTHGMYVWLSRFIMCMYVCVWDPIEWINTVVDMYSIYWPMSMYNIYCKYDYVLYEGVTIRIQFYGYSCIKIHKNDIFEIQIWTSLGSLFEILYA